MKLIQKLLRQHSPWRFIKKGFLQGLTEHQITNIEKMNSAVDIEASKQKWMEEEDKIKQKIVCFEDSESDLQISLPFTVGGADLSYIPGMYGNMGCQIFKRGIQNIPRVSKIYH
jgi:hypothetical protein